VGRQKFRDVMAHQAGELHPLERPAQIREEHRAILDAAHPSADAKHRRFRRSP